MTAPVRDRIETYLQDHPDAGVVEILGRFDLAPDQRDLVEDVLAGFDKPNDGSSTDVEATIVEPEPDVPVTEQCAHPYCDNRRVNPHPDSLCPQHFPGSTPDQQTSVDDVQEGNAEDLDEDVKLAMAEAVAGEDDSQFSGAENTPLDSSSTPASAFMGGGSEFAAVGGEQNSGATSEAPSLSGTIGGPTGALPLSQLDELTPEQRRREAKKRGLRWPSTDEARDRLETTIFEIIRNSDSRVVDAPTSLGKSHTVAATRWGARDDITDDKPVVHLSATRDARDEAIATAQAEGGEHMVLYSRHEGCPVAAGHYDPNRQAEDVQDLPGADVELPNPMDHPPITIDGVAASEWILRMCDDRGIPFSAAHRYLETHNDQGVELPCCAGDSDSYDGEEGDFSEGAPAECPSIRQWDRLRDGDHPLIIATHNFAHVPGLRTSTNVIFDEQPDFAADLGTERIRRAVSAYLEAAGAPVTTWEQFVSLARYDGYGDDAFAEREALEDALHYEPDREWFLETEGAHTLAPALARAIFHSEERANERYAGKTPYEPPRLDAHAHDDESWNREWISVVLDEDNNVEIVRTTPGMGLARSVVGLDAHPALPLWQANTLPHIKKRKVLDDQERQLWRRYERGLRVVQVGEATRPPGSDGQYFDWRGANALVEQLREEYGDAFETAITASATEQQLRDIMRQQGVDVPETMHYGEEKSRNDFADESVGLVHGCIDPGDDYVLNLIAELDLDAAPERSDVECDRCEGDGCQECDGTGHHRAHGRGWTGEDAETAQAILASVRENHTAQAAGRYARNPDDASSTATVFVRTDAMPAGFADVQVPGVVWTFGQKQERIVEELRESSEPLPAREIADRVGCSKEHVRQTLEKLLPDEEADEDGPLQAFETAGEHGATLYAADAVPNSGVVDLGETANRHVIDSYTWGLAIRDPTIAVEAVDDQATLTESTQPTIWEGDRADPGGG